MKADYIERDDRQLGYRLMAAMLLCAVPLGIEGLAAIWFQIRLPVFLAAFGITLIALVASLYVVFSWANCPSCGKKVRVDWNSQGFRGGGMLKYTCDHCRVVWLTHVFPGSDV